jgi:hypothetical protein
MTDKAKQEKLVATRGKKHLETMSNDKNLRALYRTYSKSLEAQIAFESFLEKKYQDAPRLKAAVSPSDKRELLTRALIKGEVKRITEDEGSLLEALKAALKASTKLMEKKAVAKGFLGGS